MPGCNCTQNIQSIISTILILLSFFTGLGNGRNALREKRQNDEQSGPNCPGALRGRDGRDGATGRDGANGSPGRDGRDGQPGPVGPVGPKGSEGPPGLKGDRGLSGPGGLTYVRWGRTDCANGGQVVYSGFASGSRYNINGGTSDILCLPETPQYLSQDRSATHLATLYGMEFEVFGTAPPLKHLVQANMPCALCYIETRSTVFTIPARYTCPQGFTREYYGYMMTEWNYADRQRKDTICVDVDTVPIPGSGPSTDPSVVYLMDANCNGLPCPPYVPKQPLTCAVCTK